MGWSLRKIHVASTAIIGAQLVAWTATGFAFTCFDFRTVHGDEDRAPEVAIEMGAVTLSPAEAAASARAARRSSLRDAAPIVSVYLKNVDGRPVYEVTFAGDTHTHALVDATTGGGLSIDSALARRIATGAFRGHAGTRSVERRSEEGRDVFAVRLDDPRATDVLVDAESGDIAAWQNGSYRAFDMLWSVQVLGYINRKNPAHWPLRALAAFACIATTTGALLLFSRLRQWRGRGHVHDPPKDYGAGADHRSETAPASIAENSGRPD